MAIESLVDAWIKNDNAPTLRCFTELAYQVTGLDATLRIESRQYLASRKISIYEGDWAGGKVPKWQMGFEQWRRFWDFVENTTTYFTPNNYGRVRENADWKHLYDVKARSVTYETGGVMVPETIACKRCKIVLPLDCITVDHQKPQTGGEMQAVDKMFKALGIATQQSKGRKGLWWGTQDGFDLMDMDDNPKVGYLMWPGVLFFTLLYYSGQLSPFGKACIHHAINLQPMCFRCNSAKSNWGYRS